MALPEAKTLKKLAIMCQKLGITEFSCQDFSFKIDRLAFVSKIPKRIKRTELEKALENPDHIPGDIPSEESLMFWSSGQLNEQETEVKD